jgi:hypothetical protein
MSASGRAQKGNLYLYHNMHRLGHMHMNGSLAIIYVVDDSSAAVVVVSSMATSVVYHNRLLIAINTISSCLGKSESADWRGLE